ncbi:polymorphic toxin-type HINT domain-containing protein [Micromonospora polyrhachis]|uniref:RHS repeat-associated protein n=1 Tax=Micromonospora polyrhachis TaxID=1282883 RepID=A0A7W7WRL7_9ACTN|nr:polymorphic toxin-type HINT domain-containing protein [Micromonospora polyrhachis]MBB4961426.1 RHS repeat-associated protein [Micromonospora polyrhachis]
MAITLASEIPAAAAPIDKWKAPTPKDVTGVAVAPVKPKVRPSWTAAGNEVKGTHKVAWPVPGKAYADLSQSSATAAGEAGAVAGNQAGSLPVWVASAPLSAGQDVQRGMVGASGVVDRVAVEVADRATADRAGVSGLVLKVSRADGVVRAGHVSVSVDYSAFAGAYGGDWASRLRLVMLPDGKPLASRNDTRSSTVTAEVPLAADGGATILAATAGPSGDNGDYTATSLSPSSTWQVSQQTGDFAWSYPLRMVPAVGGPEPSLGLAYSSGSVDGRTGGTNTQGSWIGDGWDMWPGYVERKFKACADDKDTERGQQPNNKTVYGGDLCWFKPEGNATISLNGRATELVKSAGNTWKGVSDDGAKIELLKDASFGNGDNDGEYWKVTAIDGTQYFFGRNSGPGGASGTAVTKSVWTAPIYGNHPDEPGYKAGDFSGSRTTQGWRWNLDYVIDPHGNTMTYFYERESGAYGREGDVDKRTTYDRGGWLSRIEYGNRADAAATTQAAARVIFDVADRCDTNCWTGADPVKASWLDTPWDQYCKTAPCTDQLAPTFWTAKRLSRIRSQVYSGTGDVYNEVEWWTLRHTYLQSGDNEGKPMWLAGITRTGKVTTAGGPEVTDPEVVFDPGTEALANRVDAMADGRSNLFRYRINTITTESGAQLAVSYSAPECVRSSLPTVHDNNKRCYPQYYAPEGEEPKLDWFHKYVVTRVDVYDNTGGFTHEQTNYDYLDTPAWHYDDSELVEEKKRTWGQFRGYGKVRVRKGLESGIQTATEYLYLRGMHGDKQPTGTRNVVVTDSQGEAFEDHEAYNGILREETTLLGSGGSWIYGTINTPVRQGPTASSGPLRAWMTNVGTVRNRTKLSGDAVRWTKTVTTYNSDNLPVQVDDLGDENSATTDDDICVRTVYARNSANWMLNRVKESKTVGVNCAAEPALPGDVLTWTRTTYDAETNDWDTYLPVKGNVAKVEEVDSWSGATPNWITTSRSMYDDNGRATEAYDVLGRKTATTFTPLVAGPVVSVRVANNLGHTATATMEPAWSLPVATVDDANAARTDLAYDGLGRVLKVWLPGRSKASHPNGPNSEFAYLVRNTAPTAVTIKSLLPSGTQAYHTSVTLYDGLLRQRQTQSQAPGGGRVLTDTVYDSRGLVEWASNPYYDSTNTPPNTTLVAGPGTAAIPSLVSNTYDEAGRLTNAILKSGVSEKWRTVTSYGGDRTSVTPPRGGTATTSITDARGRTVELRHYKNPADVGNDTPSPFDKTEYGYTRRGELASVTDAAGNTWRYVYDQRGRKVRDEDPDKGISTSTYDAAGQLLTSTDARGITLAYTYDALGRKTSLRDGSATGAKRAEWVYDTLPGGVGKITKSIRYEPAGSANAYINEIAAYDAAGRPTGSRVTIPSSEGGLCAAGTTTPCVYDYATTYRANGQVATTTLPSAAGMASEQLSFAYNDVGASDYFYSTGNFEQGYVYSTAYNKLGQLTQRVLGDYGKRTTFNYTYEESTNRLTNAYAIPEQKPEIFDFTYSYDEAGNLTSIADRPEGGAADTQCYRYDYLSRLTNAWTPTSGDCAPDPTVSELGGPAPYWHSYTHDATGNRLTETRHASSNTTRTYTYPAQGGAAGSKPHAVTSVATTGATTKTETYTYDQAGNTLTRPGDNGDQTLTWSKEGQLATVTDTTGASSYVYDADGNRLIRRDPAGSTLYLPGGMEVRKPENGAATSTRYYSHGGTVIAMRTSAGTLDWLGSDHHNTAEVTISNTNLTVSRRRTLPFGEGRGTPVGTWPTVMDKGFVGGTKDNTGLTHLGAREYDPTLGRFISVDPIMDIGDPQTWNAYAYSNNTPATLTDPKGTSPEDAQWSGLPPDKHSQENTEARYGKPGGNREDPHNPKTWTGEGPGGRKAPSRGNMTEEVYAQIVYRTHLSNLDSVRRHELRWAVFCYNYPDYCKAMNDAQQEVVNNFLLDVTGISDYVDCANGSMSGCAWVAIGFVPFGIGKAGRAGDVTATTAYRLYKGACSFGGDTLVLMADGAAKSISEIKIGDLVLAVDPETGKQGPRPVTQLWIHEDEIVNLAVGGDLLATTENHPYWNATDQQWQRADELDQGDVLLTASGGHVLVGGLVDGSTRIETAYNLTVHDIHTYYVLAGNTPVLVHNSGANPFPDRDKPKGAHGQPKPDVDAPHTQLYRDNRGKPSEYNAAQEFDENGRLVRQIHWSDHSDPSVHTNPHQHPYDPITGKRGVAIPLDGFC